MAILSSPLFAQNSGLANAVDTTADLFRVHYVGIDSHVHEFYVDGTWSDFDITAATGGPVVATASSLANAVDATQNLFRVHYVGTDSHVHEFYVDSHGWHDFDLTAATGGPTVAVGSSLANAVDTTENLFRVHYAGIDSHVHEFYADGKGWHDFDITAATGGPAVATGSSLANAVDATENLFRVHYVGGDSHVHEFYVDGKGWHDFDLTEATGGPLAEGDWIPDPPPAPYPDDLASTPTPPGGSCNITGTWADNASGGTWYITQSGNVLSGSLNWTPPVQYGCSAISWQVSGQINGSVATLTASNPIPAAEACSPGYRWTSANPVSASLALSSCTAGTANETASYPAGSSQFASGGGGVTTISGTGPWTEASRAMTFTLSSTSQITIPGAPSNAQMVPISITDSPQLTTTASVSGYSFNVTYPAQFLGSPRSSCQATLSVPSASGSTSASSNMSATSGCGGVFTVSGTIGQSATQNALYVVAPPDILVRELWGEANTQVTVGDQISELAIGNAIRQRFGDKQYFNGFNNYQDMTVAGGFRGLSRCGTGCLSTVSHSTETTDAALIYGGVSTSATDVADSKCFVSPTPDDWNKHILPALQLPTTAYPSPLEQETGCWLPANRQIVYKTSIGANASYRGTGTPAFVFIQWRDPSYPAVIQIP